MHVTLSKHACYTHAGCMSFSRHACYRVNMHVTYTNTTDMHVHITLRDVIHDIPGTLIVRTLCARTIIIVLVYPNTATPHAA